MEGRKEGRKEGWKRNDKILGLFLERKMQEREELKSLNENYIIAVHIACWFFSHSDFVGKKAFGSNILDFMLNQLEVLSQYVPYRQWVDDDDRTEEFVRSALLHCDIFPNGETMEMAYDSLDSVSILKRIS